MNASTIARTDVRPVRTTATVFAIADHRKPAISGATVVQRPSSIHIDIVGAEITIPPIKLEQHHAVAMCMALIKVALICLEVHAGEPL